MRAHLLTAVVASLVTALTVVFAVRSGTALATHHRHGHGWTVKHDPTLRQHVAILRLIRGHDRWVLRNARRYHFPAALVGFHRREAHNARRKLRKLEARLNPYPWWWVPLGICETGVNPPDPAYGKAGHPGGDGYEGWINFLQSTWLSYGGGRYAAHAYDASEYEQYLVTLRMHADVSWAQSNPACSARIGMR